jgi:hypothetical protein
MFSSVARNSAVSRPACATIIFISFVSGIGCS